MITYLIICLFSGTLLCVMGYLSNRRRKTNGKRNTRH